MRHLKMISNAFARCAGVCCMGLAVVVAGGCSRAEDVPVPALPGSAAAKVIEEPIPRVMTTAEAGLIRIIDKEARVVCYIRGLSNNSPFSCLPLGATTLQIDGTSSMEKRRSALK